MDKKGDIWISAVLYFGLGIVVITILLSAGLPVINKLRDKNIAVQTKNSFQVLDTNIREVIKGGPGTQRVLDLELKKGQFLISENKVKWSYDSKVYLSQPSDSCDSDDDIWVSEGNVKVCTMKKGSNYEISMVLKYEGLAVVTSTETISGVGRIIVRNNGINADSKITVGISAV